MRFCLLLLFFASNDVFSQPAIAGKVIDRTLKTPVKGAIVYLSIEDYTNADTVKFVTLEGKDTMDVEPEYIRTDSMVTNSSGNFSFKVLKGIKYTIECIIIMDSDGGYWNGQRHLSLNNNSNEEVILELPVYCEYTQYKNQDSCPVCKLKDKCIPTSYGLPIPDPDEKIENMFDKDKWKFFSMGCMRNRRCEARWYCKRCEKIF